MYQGLSSIQAKKFLAKYGKNSIGEKKHGKLAKMILSQFTDLMIIILLFAGLVSIFLGDNIDGIVILAIVFINAIVGFIQEYKAERILEKLQEKLEPQTIVIRDGKLQNILRENIVPGDLVRVMEGNIIPADGVIFESKDFFVNESALTGESLPVSKMEILEKSQKFIDEYIKKEAQNIDKANRLFMGTSVDRGICTLLVTSTGQRTEFGKIAKLTLGTKKTRSPLQEEMMSVGKYVGYVTLLISIILVVFGIFIQGSGIAEAIMFSASVAVAAVPEGLPTVITIALAFGVQKLARKKTLVRHLSSVESLGETTVICSDKTGTLTQNKMQVHTIYTSFGQEIVFDSQKGYDPGSGQFMGRLGTGNIRDKSWKNFSEQFDGLYDWGTFAYMVMNYCNDADIEKTKGKYILHGDPTEGALKLIAKKLLVHASGKELDRVSFSSERKMMSVLIESGGANEILSKGAPEVLIPKCGSYLNEKGEEIELNDKVLKDFDKKIEELGQQGLRILALTYKKTDSKKITEKDEQGLVLIGLVAMSDPPRLDVKDAVALTRKAGIRTIIVTGDNPRTAISIAREIGFFSPKENVKAFTHEDLDKMSDKQLEKLLDKKNNEKFLFARVMPQDKLRIVETLQKLDEIVAVTGDGINDAPALQRAHIGIAMGDGTDVSKEAAHVVLMDNSYSTIVEAIRLGREVYANLRKFSWYIFSCNIGELFTVFVAILLAVPAPLTAITILLIDLGTDILPALALSREDEGESIMDRPPKPRKQKVLTKRFIADFIFTGTVIGIIIMVQYFITLKGFGWSWGETIAKVDHITAATVTFVSLVMIQLANSFNARNLNKSIFKITKQNTWHLLAISSSTILVIAFTTIPFFERIFKLSTLSLSQWFSILLCMILIIVFQEFKKVFRKSEI